MNPVATIHEATEYCSLDERVIHLWRLEKAIFYGILFTFYLLGCLVAFLKKSELWPWLLIPLGLMLVYQLAMLKWYPPWRYRHTGYRLDDKVLEIQRGIWWKTWHLVPLPRLQHADIVSGPMERWFGLATLIIHTAGTHDSVLLLEGLSNETAIELRDRLVALGGDEDGLGS